MSQPLVKNFRVSEHAFARRYMVVDVTLLGAMGALSGLAPAYVLRSQRDVFGNARFDRLGSISLAYLYNPGSNVYYRQQRVEQTKARGHKAAAISARRAPSAGWCPRSGWVSSVSAVSSRGALMAFMARRQQVPPRLLQPYGPKRRANGVGATTRSVQTSKRGTRIQAWK